MATAVGEVVDESVAEARVLEALKDSTSGQMVKFSELVDMLGLSRASWAQVRALSDLIDRLLKEGSIRSNLEGCSFYLPD